MGSRADDGEVGPSSRTDVWRSCVPILQSNLFAMALDPSQGVDREDWRRQLSEDYHDPSLNLPLVVGVAHRLRRVSLPLLFVLLAAWAFRIGAFDREGGVVEAATIGAVPGSVVIGLVVAGFAAAICVTRWPRIAHDEADGEFTGVDAEWKESEWKP